MDLSKWFGPVLYAHPVDPGLGGVSCRRQASFLPNCNDLVHCYTFNIIAKTYTTKVVELGDAVERQPWVPSKLIEILETDSHSSIFPGCMDLHSPTGFLLTQANLRQAPGELRTTRDDGAHTSCKRQPLEILVIYMPLRIVLRRNKSKIASTW